MLYESLGVYLPLITTNCAVLGVARLDDQRVHLLELGPPRQGEAVDGREDRAYVGEAVGEGAPRSGAVRHGRLAGERGDRQEEVAQHARGGDGPVRPDGAVDGDGVQRGEHRHVGGNDIRRLEKMPPPARRENEHRRRHGVRPPERHGDGVEQADHHVAEGLQCRRSG